jgi:hypothetical protein
MPGGIPSNTLGVLIDIIEKTAACRFTHEELALFAKRQNPFEKDPLPHIDWHPVYEKLGMKADFWKFLDGKVNVTEPDQNLWLVPVLKGVTASRVLDAFRQLQVPLFLKMENPRIVDFDRDVIKNDRDPSEGNYVVLFKKTVEPDPDLVSKSAEDLKKAGILGITLIERLLLGLGYYLTTGQHLDYRVGTLCSGSRFLDARIPSLHWGPNNPNCPGLSIGSYSCYDGFSFSRSRAVIVV